MERVEEKEIKKDKEKQKGRKLWHLKAKDEQKTAERGGKKRQRIKRQR